MSVPQHQQLAEALLIEIVDGRLAVGDRLPTEVQLSESNGLARGTIRRALGHLEDLGMISRRPGAGTVVVAPSPVARYQPIAQSAADIAALTVETKLVAPDIGEVVVDKALARRIGTRPGATWFRIEGARVYRKGDGVPLCWSEHYLRGDVSRTTLLRGVLTAEEVAHATTQQTIYADLLDGHIAEALEAQPGAAAIVISRRAWDERGRLLSVGIHTHRGDRYQITSSL
jgi:DNA-binding GntR family transcriptional regulator